MPRSLAKTWVQTWGKMDIKETQVDLDQNVLARCAAVALASILNPSGGYCQIELVTDRMVQ